MIGKKMPLTRPKFSKNMITRKQVFILVTAGPFLTAFFCSLLLASPASTSTEYKTPTAQKTNKAHNSFTGKESLREQSTGRINMLSFIKKLRGTPTPEEMNQLYEDAFHPVPPFTFDIDTKRWMVIEKWGAVAPLQGLEKMQQLSSQYDYIFPLFSGWASKNPEAAAAYYDEHYKKEAQYSQRIINAIISEYAAHSPDKAWQWLCSQEREFPESKLDTAKSRFFDTVAQKYPERIPDLVKQMGENQISRESAYMAGTAWGLQNSGIGDWMSKLPEESRVQAKAGYIMGITKGNIEKVEEQLFSVPQEEKMKITRELAEHLQNRGTMDKAEQINWIMDTLPESEVTDCFSLGIGYWMRKDRKGAAELIQSLPPGRKKDLLQEWSGTK